jgi:hypothetical protein
LLSDPVSRPFAEIDLGNGYPVFPCVAMQPAPYRPGR